jgi:hypothetical protein
MKKNKEDSIEIKLIDDLSNSEISKIAVDISEVALDSIFEDGILRDLPVVSTVVGIVKTSKNIRDKLYAKKILLFLQSSNDCAIEKREAFISKLNKNPKEKQKVGETIILILEKSDEMKKPIIIGNLFKAYLVEDISYSEFIKLSSIVNKTSVNDLYLLVKMRKDKKHLPTELAESLAINGLMSFGIMEQPLTMDMDKISPHLFYVPNKIAMKLLKFGL